MRSNNFFDQFNDELGNAATIVRVGLVIAGIIILFTVLGALFWCAGFFDKAAINRDSITAYERPRHRNILRRNRHRAP